MLWENIKIRKQQFESTSLFKEYSFISRSHTVFLHIIIPRKILNKIKKKIEIQLVNLYFDII